MSLKIGSFNVLNFNSDTKLNKDFKENKAKQISEIIKNNNLDIIALQEIQTWGTVGRILAYLNMNSTHGQYKGCHSEKPYEELNDDYQNKTGNEFKSEYAFIWNSEKIKLVRDPFVYKSIYDRILKYLDIFIKTTIGVLTTLSTGILLTNTRSEEDLSPQNESNDQKIDTKDRFTAASAVIGTGVSSVALTSRVTNQTVKPILRERVEEILKNTLRPPLVGIFESTQSMKPLQLRIINTHTQFKKTAIDIVGEVTLRKMEVGFLLNVIFEIVHSQRTGNHECVKTLIAGDFNLDISQIEDAKKDFCSKSKHTFKVEQKEKSTIKLINKEKVKTQAEKPKYEHANSYDHFIFSAFDEKEWDQAVLLDDEKLFFIEINDIKYPISDHYPIKITYQNA